MDTVSVAALPSRDANEREIMLMHVMTGHTARGPLWRHTAVLSSSQHLWGTYRNNELGAHSVDDWQQPPPHPPPNDPNLNLKKKKR